MLLARLSSWLELKLVSLPFSFFEKRPPASWNRLARGEGGDPRLLGTVFEEKVEVDGDVVAIQEGVSERRHMLSVLDCVVCPCRLGSSISHLRDRCFITTGSQVLQRNNLQILAPQRDLSVGPGDGGVSTAIQLLLLVLLMVEVADLLLVSTFKAFQIGDSLA